MKIFKIIGGCLLISILVLIFLLLPTKAEKLRSDNNALGYLELLKKAKVSQPNPNVYASSQITPDNPVFKGVLALQRRRLDIAVKELLPLAEAGNVDAMYWYGETILYAGAYNSMSGAEWLEKAAKLGNPYAALRFDPDNEDCKYYLAGRCSEEWAEKGEALLKARAEQGDVKAQYYTNVRIKRGSAEDYQFNIDLVTQAVNQGYYIPLMQQISWLEEDKSLDDKKNKPLLSC